MPRWQSYVATTTQPIFTPEQCKMIIDAGHQCAPEQAKVYQQVDGGPMVELIGKTADGKEMPTLTPATLDNLDINRMYRFKLKFTDTLKRAVELSDKEKKERGRKTT